MVYTTINVTGNAQLLLAGKPLNPGQLGLGFTLANNDETNTVWVGTKQNMTPTDSGVVPCAPLGSIPIDAGSTTYIVSAGPTVQCFLIPGGGTWAPSPAQVAAQIAALGLATLTAQNTQIGQLSSGVGTTIATDVSNTGAPVLHGFNELVTDVATVVPVSITPTTLATVSLKKPGYIINAMASISASATSPFVQITMTWTDSSGSNVLAIENWVFPATSGAVPMPIIGRGQVKGPRLVISAINIDPGFSETVTITFLETSFAAQRDDWRSIYLGYTTAPTVPGYTVIQPGLTQNEIGNEAIGLAVNTAATFLLPLYAGEIGFFAAGSLGDSLQCTIQTPPGIGEAYGGSMFVWQNTAIPGEITGQTCILPRCVCEVILKNGPTATQTLTFTGTLFDYS